LPPAVSSFSTHQPPLQRERAPWAKEKCCCTSWQRPASLWSLASVREGGGGGGAAPAHSARTHTHHWGAGTAQVRPTATATSRQKGCTKSGAPVHCQAAQWSSPNAHAVLESRDTHTGAASGRVLCPQGRWSCRAAVLYHDVDPSGDHEATVQPGSGGVVDLRGL
jgi:hypothetical protein